jgi:hypothetical protein
MLLSRNAFERYKGLGSREKEAAIPSTSQLRRKKKNTDKRHPDGPQQMLTAGTCSAQRGQR